MEKPSDHLKRLTDGSAFAPLWELYRKQHEKSSLDLYAVEEELGMLEAMLIDELEFDVLDRPHDESLAVGSDSWWNQRISTLKTLNPGLKDLNIEATILEILRGDGDDIQEELFNLLGAESFEMMAELIDNRYSIIEASKFRVDEINHLATTSKPPAKSTKRGERRLRKEEGLSENLKAIYGQTEALQYPYVFSASSSRPIDVSGKSLALPLGTNHTNTMEYESFTIPHNQQSFSKASQYEPISIASFQSDALISSAFQNYKELNRVQSICFPIAYQSNENMLVCAPTGAGKTDIAMLTVLKCIKDHLTRIEGQYAIDKDAFKIVYVAPMKALASEITAKFSKRLSRLGISVKECTGDMQMSRQEIQQTQMLVTTPEKWDVLSRKGVGDVELVQLVKLLIIDEVHLLHDDRGAVLEAIVARTLRQVEIGQSMIRILGLSATLPNYIDVAQFLRVNPFAGMFFFDDAFRAVPLTQHFIGIKGHSVGLQQERMMRVCYDRCIQYLLGGHQVMIFVHSRNDTVKTAKSLLRLAGDAGFTFSLDSEHDRFQQSSKDCAKSRNAELKVLFDYGIGVHHAGMVRSDRNLTEAMFESGLLKVLICTATLAWGVNLPAHAVIIKGTQVFDSDRGGFVDLSVLDVLQIFGRAGRPQYETHGEGTILTTHDRLSHYVHAICSQTPIESKFISHLPDNLNAEIALGTVSNIREAVQWLAYTFLYVRMRRNPLAYGISIKDRLEDPHCDAKLVEICRQTAEHLKRCSMIAYDRPDDEGFLKIRNIGRIASLFYLSHRTVELFVKLLKPEFTLEGLIEIICQSSEYDSLKVRAEELEELDTLRQNNAFVRIRGDPTSVTAKVNTLVQCYISRAQPEMFSLQADMNYIQQNTGRIMRALFEIVKGLGWSTTTARVLGLCCAFERRRWVFEHPLLQFENIPTDVIGKLNECQIPLEDLVDSDLKEIGLLTRNHKAAGIMKTNLKRFPLLTVNASMLPLTRSVLKVVVRLVPNFSYDRQCHHNQESFHVWVEDGPAMLSYQFVQFGFKDILIQSERRLEFFLQIKDKLPSQFVLRILSDRWLHSEHVVSLPTNGISVPNDAVAKHTELLSLRPLRSISLQNAKLVDYMNRKQLASFNPVQTQVFHTLYHRDCNVLIGAPTGSGKTLMAELAIFRQLFSKGDGRKIVYLAPLKALVRERILDWTGGPFSELGIRIVELTGDHNPSSRDIREADMIVSTLEKWDGVSRKWREREFVQKVGLLIMDEIHLLGVPVRGAILEAIIMRLNAIQRGKGSVRVIGLSTALANAADLADWLRIPVDIGLYNFSPAVRPVPCVVRIEGFPGIHYCPRMASMNKPLYGHIKTLSDGKPTLVFVSSRRQTRLTAQALISLDSLNSSQRSFLKMTEVELETVSVSIEDPHLKHSLSFGIGLHHAGLSQSDRSIVERLFLEHKILVLIATGTLAWGVNLPAFLVIVKGTEYFDAKSNGYVDMPVTDVMQMVGRAGRPQFDVQARAVLLVAESKKSFYRNFLYESFPVESSLPQTLADHLNAEIVSGNVKSLDEGLEWLQTSFLARRIKQNPSYYFDTNQQEAPSYFCKLVTNAIEDLELSGCCKHDRSSGRVERLFPGWVASFYYLQHMTIRDFVESIESIDSVDSVFRLIANAHEYDDAPLRHNEDSEVRDFVTAHRRQLSISSDFLKTADFSRPNTKIYVLLAAWISRTPLPFCDFVTDQSMALEQSQRIAQSIMELLTVKGKARECIACLGAMQCLQQACKPDSDTLSPYFTKEEVEFLKSNRIHHLPQLLAEPQLAPPGFSLPDVDVFKGLFTNLGAFVGRLKAGSTWYAIYADAEDSIMALDRLHNKYALRQLPWARLYIVSDCWFGLDQQYEGININNNY